MSKTDKTRPWWVQVADPNNLGWVQEQHDHRNHICDLPPLTVDAVERWSYRRWKDTQCLWSYTSRAYHSNRLWRRRSRKGGWGRPRREGKARMQLRRLRGLWAVQDAEDVDSTMLLPSQAWLNNKWRD